MPKLKTKKKLISGIVAFLFTFFFVPLTIDAQIPTVRIAGDNHFPPYEFVNDKGIYRGFNVDIMNAIAIEMGIDIELIPMTWQDAIIALNNKQVDAIQGMTYSKERSKDYIFSKPLIQNTQRIFVRNDNKYVVTLNDLSNKKVSFQKGDVVESIIKQSECLPVPVKNQKQAIDLLLNDQVEAFVGNQLTGTYYLQSQGITDKIKIVGDSIFDQNYCIVTLKSNPEIYQLLNEGLIQIKKNGTYKKIYEKWFGKELLTHDKFLTVHLIAFFIVLFIILIISFTLFLFNRKLQKMVHRRTKQLESSKIQLESSNRQLHELAYYDTLTGLPNRTFFRDQLNTAILNFRNNNQYFSIMYIDLDNFKYINDTFGHNYGNNVLKEVAARFKSIKYPSLFFSRLGGDEFAVLFYNKKDENFLQNKAFEILNLINQPFIIHDFNIKITASIGIVICHDKKTTHDIILRDADIAMYKSKELGKNRSTIFNKNMNAEISEKLMLSNALLNAIDNNELSLSYQPVYDTSDNRILSFEALLRWTNQYYGSVPPEKFIKIAEENGYISKIGLWTIKESCRFIKKANDIYKNRKITISINLSPKQLLQDDFIDRVIEIIEENSIPYEWIAFEITETTLIHSYSKCTQILSALENKGISIYLDDFGIGYSSLSYLWRLPISTVKIDRSFVNHLVQNPKVKELTDSIIRLFKKLDMDVIAEGVETEKQLELLTAYGCSLIQGFLLSKPLKEEDALMLCSTENQK